MTAPELLLELTGLGVQIAADPDGNLRLLAPAGVLTREIRDAVASHKPALLALLAAEPGEWDPEQAGQIITMTIADIDAEHGAEGYDRREWLRFNDAVAAAFSVRSVRALRTACVALRNAVKRRLAAAASEAA